MSHLVTDFTLCLDRSVANNISEGLVVNAKFNDIWFVGSEVLESIVANNIFGGLVANLNPFRKRFALGSG